MKKNKPCDIAFAKKHLRPICPVVEKSRLIFIKEFIKHLKAIDLKKVMGGDNCIHSDPVEYFFSNYPISNSKRDFRVIASFLCYLGSNGGHGFYRIASEFKSSMNNPQKAFYLALAVENRRVLGINYGSTLLEQLLTPNEYKTNNGGILIPINKKVSIYDLEILNFFVEWLATDSGEKFYKRARKKSDKLREKERRIALRIAP